jgi:hypothetical protein
MMVLRQSPDRFFFSENLEVADNRAFMINGATILTRNELGTSVVKSNLREIGTLKSLRVTGNAELGGFASFDSDVMRIAINVEKPVGIMTLSDFEQDVLINIEVENGRGKIGTYNTRPFDIVAGDQILITVDPKNRVNLGFEYKGDTEIVNWGRVGVNVKHPEEELEVRGNIKFGGKLFAALNTAPDRGNYKRGDIVWCNEPSIGGPIGWVCITSGNPGRWASFGVINE